MANGNEAGSGDPVANTANTTTPAALTAALGGLLAPRTAATFPQFVHPDVFGYATHFAQLQDALGMPSRYPQSPFWGNGAGRYAYGTAPYGTPAYGNPAGRNAPWWVTGANGQGGQYPNPGTILGQGNAQPGQPGGYTGGLLGQPKVAVDPSFGNNNGMLGGSMTGPPSAPASPPPQGYGGNVGGISPQPGLLPSGSAHYTQPGVQLSQSFLNQYPEAARQGMLDAVSTDPSLLTQYQGLKTDADRAQFMDRYTQFAKNMLSSGMQSPQQDQQLYQNRYGQ